MTDTIERLEAALRPAAHDAPHESWHVATLDDAAWASRKAARARHELARITAWREREIERVNAAAEREMQRHENNAGFFEGHLAAYLAAEVRAGRRTKSLELPGGTIKLTARQPRIDTDDTAVLAWARDAGRNELVRVKEALDKNALKAAATLAEDGVLVIDGEIVPGATWEAQEDSASFVPASDGAAS